MNWETLAWEFLAQWNPPPAMAPVWSWSRRWPTDRRWAELHGRWQLYWRRRWRHGFSWIHHDNQYIQVP